MWSYLQLGCQCVPFWKDNEQQQFQNKLQMRGWPLNHQYQRFQKFQEECMHWAENISSIRCSEQRPAVGLLSTVKSYPVRLSQSFPNQSSQSDLVLTWNEWVRRSGLGGLLGLGELWWVLWIPSIGSFIVDCVRNHLWTFIKINHDLWFNHYSGNIWEYSK